MLSVGRERRESILSTITGSENSAPGGAAAPGTDSTRVWALGGVAFVILLIVAFFASGASPPNVDDSIATITKYYVQHHTGILISDFVGVAATLPMLFFLGALWRAVRSSETTGGAAAVVAVIGIVFGGAMINLAQAIDASLAFKAAKLLDGGSTRLAFDVLRTTHAYVSFPFVASIVATSMVALRSGFLPRWLAFVGFLTSAVMLIGTFSVFADTSNILNLINLIGFILFLVWILSVSLSLYLRPQPAGGS
jgi:hypothetical protein